MPRWSVLANDMFGFGRLIRLVGIVALLMAPTARLAGAYPIDPNWSPPTIVYIPETGHTIDGLFLDLWRSGGGSLAFGNPITAEITLADGHVEQYYEYARFEYWPDGDEDGNAVTLGKFGQEIGPPMLIRRFEYRANVNPLVDAGLVRAWQPLTEEDAQGFMTENPSYRFVPETGHRRRFRRGVRRRSRRAPAVLSSSR